MKSSTVSDKIHGLKSLIGNTPLLEIKYNYNGETRIIYVKAEHLNMTGSIKDRMAFHIIQKGYERGLLKPGYSIIEATSGNTGISFAAIGRALGHPVIIFMPDWVSKERMNLIQGLGATIKLVSKKDGGFIGSIKKAEELALSKRDTFLPRQFSNEDNIEAHYLTTGPEIWWQLFYRSLISDAFIAGVGTGGTIMGVGKFLREKNPEIKLYPLEPANSPILTTGYNVGKHRIQGISDEFVPPILHLKELDDIISVDDGDAILMAQKLASELGIGVGISSGANFIGAIQVQNKRGYNTTVATVFPDDNQKYLSTDLLKKEPEKKEYHSLKVKLLSYKSFKRVCHTCCDPTECIEVKNPAFKDKITLPPCPRRP